MDYVEPSTSSSAAATSQPPTAEPAPTGSTDGQGSSSGLKNGEDKMEGDNEQVTEEVPKKSSSIRFRKKPKQPKQRGSKGLWLHYVWTVMVEVLLITLTLPLRLERQKPIKYVQFLFNFNLCSVPMFVNSTQFINFV